MNIRNFIKRLTPHGIIMSRNKNRFLEDYDKWQSDGGQVLFDETCRFDSFVSIDGFGSSGSSAVMDLLREYEGCTVWATKPSFTESTDDVSGMGEMNLMRMAGGLLYLEKFFEEDAIVNVFWCDSAIKAFMGLAYYSDQYKFHPELRPIFYGFFSRIVSQRLISDKQLMNPYLNPYSSLKDIFYLKRMTKEEYHTISREFIYTLFNKLFPKANGGLLVLDHIFDDCSLDTKMFEPYLPGIKRIKVSRDIRGVYVDAIRHNHRWLAHDTVNDFITWEKNVYYGHKNDTKDYLTVRFESLVENYEHEVSKIEQFLNLHPHQHTRKNTFFDPELSRKNIRIWDNSPKLNDDCSEILTKEPELCYMGR